MLFYFYKSYKYAPKTTNLSGLTMGLAVIGAICGPIALLAYFMNENAHKPGILILGIVLLALAAISYFWLYRVVVPAQYNKEYPENLKTNVSVAFQYVRDNPDQYGYICTINPAFEAKYVMQEKGGVMQPVKRK